MAEEFFIIGSLDFGTNRDAVLEHFQALAARSRTEPGCLAYLVSPDLEDDGRINVVERWVDMADLVAHFETAQMAVFRAAIASYPRLARTLERCIVTRSEPFSSASIPSRAS